MMEMREKGDGVESKQGHTWLTWVWARIQLQALSIVRLIQTDTVITAAVLVLFRRHRRPGHDQDTFYTALLPL